MDPETAVWQPDQSHPGWAWKFEAQIVEVDFGSVDDPNACGDLFKNIQRRVGIKGLAPTHAQVPGLEEDCATAYRLFQTDEFLSFGKNRERNQGPFLKGSSSPYSRNASSI